ncbi:hypothetical protein [Micromonospora sp. IBHARD004]|uniref:hypothetical protein n=1 Tax=Micromonospora sp. IBHARD004 TaxID=3457764 RepID=UPI004059C686
MQAPGHIHDVVQVVVLGKLRPQEHPPDVYVEGDVAAGQIGDRHAQVAGEDLHCHCRLLLPDAGEPAQADSELGGPGAASPDRAGVREWG